MTPDMAFCIAFALAVVWDLGRRFASRGRAVSAEDLDHLTDRVALCESLAPSHAKAVADVRADLAAMEAKLKLMAEKHNVMAINVAEHGKAITSLGLRSKR